VPRRGVSRANAHAGCRGGGGRVRQAVRHWPGRPREPEFDAMRWSPEPILSTTRSAGRGQVSCASANIQVGRHPLDPQQVRHLPLVEGWMLLVRRPKRREDRHGSDAWPIRRAAHWTVASAGRRALRMDTMWPRKPAAGQSTLAIQPKVPDLSIEHLYVPGSIMQRRQCRRRSFKVRTPASEPIDHERCPAIRRVHGKPRATETCLVESKVVAVPKMERVRTSEERSVHARTPAATQIPPPVATPNSPT